MKTLMPSPLSTVGQAPPPAYFFSLVAIRIQTLNTGVGLQVALWLEPCSGYLQKRRERPELVETFPARRGICPTKCIPQGKP